MQPERRGHGRIHGAVQLLGVEPYITVNAGFGDAHSAADWVSYCNSPETSPMGKLRAANAIPNNGVKFWGVGNERGAAGNWAR